MRYVVGVDVGTGSARAGIFDETGRMYATAQRAIALHRPQPEWAEQSSTSIWASICASVQECLSSCDIDAVEIDGISFSATCSLVLLDRNNEPLLLSEGSELWDVVVWMDHRAVSEAAQISASGSIVLETLGGVMSPEMQIPKLMWLRAHRPELWERLGYAGDLADYLTFRCSGSIMRSVCTMGCKWTFDPDLNAWNHTFLSQVGLDDLLNKASLPDTATPIGTGIGVLTAKAASELGLTTRCQVATGLIDAHSGALGTLGLFADNQVEERLALIAGTSNCHIALSRTRREVPGVWGPYAGAVTPAMWANEGGQSVTGALLDHIVNLFSAGAAYGDNPHAAISKVLSARLASAPDFASAVQVIPDFLGNRSPYANPELRGAISGLTIEDTHETFLKVYWAAAVSIAYGTRLIIDRLNENGYRINTIHLSGGHKKSELLVGLYCDATGCDVVLSPFEEPVLLGAAIAALAPLSEPQGMAGVIGKISGEYTVRRPEPSATLFHNDRYKIFLDQYGV
ncbi:MAG: FGGY-family carbohydrate kinase [Granulosicoccus sp.]